MKPLRNTIAGIMLFLVGLVFFPQLVILAALAGMVAVTYTAYRLFGLKTAFLLVIVAIMAFLVAAVVLTGDVPVRGWMVPVG